MSRLQANVEQIPVRHQSNAITVLAAAAVLVTILGMIAIVMRANFLLDHGLFGK